jgi:flavodoxin
MKALVVYDSQFGNTERVAYAVGEALGETHQVQVARAGDLTTDQLQGLDLLVVGSPTQRFSPTAGTNEFLQRLPTRSLQGVRVAAFDTRLTVEEIESIRVLSFFVRIFGYAAKPIANHLRKQGGQLALPPEGFYVEGTEGPLVAGELERAQDWARRIAAAA